MMRKLFITFFFIHIITAIYAQTVNAPAVTARGAVLLDRYSGCTLWEKNADQQLPMASTTKIMTAIIIIDKGADKLNDTVKVSKHAFGTGGSSVFAMGDQPTLEELLKAIMLRSSNEATVAAAEYLGGGGIEGEKLFVKWMNDKASAMGLKNTHFTNPHGLYNVKHYSSARDLAKMARYALATPIIAEVITTKNCTINVPPRGNVWLDNHNRDIGKCLDGLPGAIIDGVKTGYVKESGQCLVSSASCRGWQLISVVLNSEDKFGENKALLSYGFRNFAWKTYVKENKPILSVPITGADIDKIPVGSVSLLGLPAMIGDNNVGQVSVVGNDGKPLKKLDCPITRGQAVGTVQLIVNNNLVSAVPAIALVDATASVKLKVLRILKQIGIVLAAMLIGGFLIGKIAKISRRYRRRLKARSRKANPDGQSEG